MGSRICCFAASAALFLSACYHNPSVGAYTHPATDAPTTVGGDANAVPGPITGTNPGASDTNFQFQAAVQWANDLVGTAWSNGDAAPRFVGDFNGDGKVDIVGMDGNNTLLGLSTGSSFASVTTQPSDYPNARAWTSEDTMPRAQGDVNGDGTVDFVGFGGGVWIDAGTPSGFVADNASWTTEFYGGAWTDEAVAPRLVGDVNGDGKADVVGIDPNGVHVALSTGSSFAPSTLWSNGFVSSVGWTSQAITPRLLADFNGDGKVDLVGFGNANVVVGISTGTAFDTVNVSTEFVGSAWNQDTAPRFAGDVDGDGKADLVAIDGEGVHVALSTGTSAAKSFVAFSGLDPNNGWASQNATPRFLGDVNGDKKADVVGFSANAVEVFLAR